MKSQFNKNNFCQFIEELVDGDCKCRYCFLKIFIESIHPDPCILVQLKCIEKFKWEESEREGFDIGWNEAAIRWAEKGYAKEFRKKYEENKRVSTIYKEIILAVQG